MAIGTAAAILGAGALGALASSKASSKAADAQIQSSNDANARLDRQFDITRADQLALLERQRQDQAPWLDAGKNALARMVSGTGQGGEFMRSFGASDFAADPGYQFRMAEGQKALERSAAARGGLLSGAALKAASRYSQDMASTEYGNAYNRFNANRDGQFNKLASLAGVGQTATQQIGQAGQNAYGTIANAGMNTAQQVGQNITGAGNARASGYVGTANALTNALGQGINYWQNSQYLDYLKNKGGA